jgi:hypothetical protein
LACLFAVIHAGGVVVTAVVPMPWVIRILIWLALGLSFIQIITIHAWRWSTSAVAVIEMDSESYVALRYVGEELWHPARITSRFIHPWLTVMSLRVEGRRWPVNVVIAVDAVEPEPFRRWRAALKLQTEAT